MHRSTLASKNHHFACGSYTSIIKMQMPISQIIISMKGNPCSCKFFVTIKCLSYANRRNLWSCGSILIKDSSNSNPYPQNKSLSQCNLLGKGHWEDPTERRVAARAGRPMAFIKRKFHL
jgi:hypothetical protein